MNVEKLKQLKKDAGYTNKMIADDSGVPIGTVQKIFSGETKAPRFKTLKAIEAVLIPASGIMEGTAATGIMEGTAATGNMNAAGSTGIRNNETDAGKPAAPAKVRKTEMSSDDVHNVNIGGTESVTGNKLLHKLIADDIIFVIRKYMTDNNIPGFVNGSHVGVRLDADNPDGGDMIAPDVTYIPGKEMLSRQGIKGAPWMIVEIMDGETRSNEIGSKPDMYRDSGVKEYWMIDIDAKNIMVYDFEREAFPSMYGFSGKVPVRTLGEDCLVNFAQVYSHLGFLFEG